MDIVPNLVVEYIECFGMGFPTLCVFTAGAVQLCMINWQQLISELMLPTSLHQRLECIVSIGLKDESQKQLWCTITNKVDDFLRSIGENGAEGCCSDKDSDLMGREELPAMAAVECTGLKEVSQTSPKGPEGHFRGHLSPGGNF